MIDQLTGTTAVNPRPLFLEGSEGSENVDKQERKPERSPTKHAFTQDIDEKEVLETEVKEETGAALMYVKADADNTHSTHPCGMRASVSTQANVSMTQ